MNDRRIPFRSGLSLILWYSLFAVIGLASPIPWAFFGVMGFLLIGAIHIGVLRMGENPDVRIEEDL